MVTKPTRQSRMSDKDMDTRISFDDEREILIVDFSNLRLKDLGETNSFFDRIEARIYESGHAKWFILVDYANCRIERGAVETFARRGRALNMAHSQGTVRIDPSAATRDVIAKASGGQDPQIFGSREAAVEFIATQQSQRSDEALPSFHHETEIATRVTFLEELGIMDVDFSNFTFNNARDVDDMFDHAEKRIAKTGRKWFFLVNLNNCVIEPAAWVHYARRGKDLNIACSLGTARYAAGSETAAEIRMRAKSQDFRPNIFNHREDALAYLERLARPAAAE